MPKPSPSSTPDDAEVKRQLRRMTRRGLAVGAASLASLYLARKWIFAQSKEDGLAWPLRRILRFNEKVANASFSPKKLAREFDVSRAAMPRVNGPHGVDLALDLDAWRLKIVGPTGRSTLTLADVKAFPKVTMTTELKCIEGWSQVVTWAGARLFDLAEATGLATKSGAPGNPHDAPADLLPYAGLTTPDGKYYVGLDMPSALHPQTLLCYEMNGEPLTRSHGAPLRLAIPVKQIGTLFFSQTQPADYWEKKGYDFHSGL